MLNSAPAQQSQLGKGNQLARRRYQRGSLSLQGDKWIGKWREDVIENGQIRRISKKRIIGTKADFPTKRLAQRELDRRLATINSPNYQAAPRSTFIEFAEKWAATVLPQMKRSTQLAIRSQLRNSLTFFNDLRMEDITAMAVQSFVAQSKYSPKSIRNDIATLRSMWNSAKAWSYVVHDPFVSLVLPQSRKKAQPFLTVEQMRQVIAAAKEPYQTFFWLAAETGMRAGELAGLRWEDVDGTVIRVRQSVWRGKDQSVKSDAGVRTFSISQPLSERLAALHTNGVYVFATKNGTPFDPNLVVKRKLKPILRRMGIDQPGMGLHALRHGHETYLDRAQAPIALRLNRLGHSDTRMMVNYSHVIGEDDKKIAAELGQVLRPFASFDSTAVTATT